MTKDKMEMGKLWEDGGKEIEGEGEGGANGLRW